MNLDSSVAELLAATDEYWLIRSKDMIIEGQ